MSIEELPGLLAQLKEAEEMLNRVEIKADTLKVEMIHVTGNLREVEYILYRVTSLMGRMGLPPEIDRAINLLQRTILVARLLHTTVKYMMMSSPEGWILAALTTITSMITIQSIAGDMRGS